MTERILLRIFSNSLAIIVIKFLMRNSKKITTKEKPKVSQIVIFLGLSKVYKIIMF